MAVAVLASFYDAAQSLDAESARQVFAFLARFPKDPASSGISLERVERSPSKGVWAGRVSGDLRAILFKDGEVWTLVHVDHHDAAYRWAERRRIERHVKTGALQIVEQPEVVEAKLESSGAAPVFDRYSDDYLLSLGVPPDWLSVVRQVRSQNDLATVLERLPQEAAERLADLSSGQLVVPPAAHPADRPAAENPDTQRRLVLLDDNQELLRMWEAPMAKWIAFLHPDQRRLATGSFKGPLKVTGSAGTGKTVVALHRARHLARQGRQVLLTSYMNALCHNLQRNLTLFCDPEELQRITVSTVFREALGLLQQAGESVEAINDERTAKLLERCAQRQGCNLLDRKALLLEWQRVVRAQGIESWEGYRAADRTGRGYPLTLAQRKALWGVFAAAMEELSLQGKLDYTGVSSRALSHLREGRVRSRYDAVVVDEVQDLGPQELRLLAALAGDGPDNLTLVGDGGQRIFANRFSLSALGINVRGRSHVLRLSYRMTDKIRRFADALVDPESDDLDGGREDRRGTRSLVLGTDPTLRGFTTEAEQTEFVVERVQASLATGLSCDEIGIFARKKDSLLPLQSALERAGVPCHWISSEKLPEEPAVGLGSMHAAKGLEFKTVFVTHVSLGMVPLDHVVLAALDSESEEEVLLQERQLLYVSATRARHDLYITWVGKPSEFLSALV